MPAFAGELDPAIRQLHSSDYKRPSQLRPGGVLVVGASHSGGDIAFEAGAAGHPVVLSGPIHGEIPFRLEKPAAKVAFPDPVLPGQARAHHAHADRAARCARRSARTAAR